MASILEKTLVPLWLGAGKSAGNAFLGAPGALIKSFGNENTAQPLTDEQLRLQSELFRTSGLALGLPEHLSNPDFTQPEQDFFTKTGNYLLDTNTRIQDNVNQARQDFLGDDPELLSRAMEGLGTMAIPALAGWAGGQSLVSAALSGLTEAAAETGNFATDINSQGRFRQGNS